MREATRRLKTRIMQAIAEDAQIALIEVGSAIWHDLVISFDSMVPFSAGTIPATYAGFKVVLTDSLPPEESVIRQRNQYANQQDTSISV